MRTSGAGGRLRFRSGPRKRSAAGHHGVHNNHKNTHQNHNKRLYSRFQPVIRYFVTSSIAFLSMNRSFSRSLWLNAAFSAVFNVHAINRSHIGQLLQEIFLFYLLAFSASL